MNDDLISRSTIKHAIYDVCLRKNNIDIFKELLDRINELPPVNPQEPKMGHWIEKDGFDGDVYYDCSECGESWVTIEGTPWQNGMAYCPNCGARMAESEEAKT